MYGKIIENNTKLATRTAVTGISYSLVFSGILTSAVAAVMSRIVHVCLWSFYSDYTRVCTPEFSK